MDLQRITRHDIDDHLRVEAGVDVLAGGAPRPRLVLFERTSAVLAADARPRRADEAWLDHVTELLYLARVLRPRGMALCFTMAPDDPQTDPSFVLHVVTADRILGSRCRTRHRVHPFLVSEDGMVTWQPPQVPSDRHRYDAFGAAAMRRTRTSRRRHPGMVARFLVGEGHRVRIAPSLSARIALDGVPA